MPNIKRSPPLATGTRSVHSRKSLPEQDSESSSFVDTETFESNITLRKKKNLKQNCSAQDQTDQRLCSLFAEFKEEVKQMLETWKSEQSKVLSKIITEVSDLKIQCQGIQKVNGEIEKSIEFINSKYDDMRNRLGNLENGQKGGEEHIKNLVTQIEDINLKARPATIELRNIPSQEKETTSDLFSIISGIGKAVDNEVQRSGLRDVYRLPGKPGLTRTMVAEFTSVVTKNEFLVSIRRFNKSRPLSDKLNTQTIGLTCGKQPIYVDDHLPPSSRKLFFEARQVAKKNNYYCWLSNGKILMRKGPNEKPIPIKSAKCLALEKQ